MKKLLSISIVCLLIFSVSTSTVFADSIDAPSIKNNIFTSDILEMASELNSTPIILDDGSIFIPDNRPSTLELLREEQSEYISPSSSGTIEWGYVVKSFYVPAPASNTCKVKCVSHVKVIHEASVFRFLECQSVQWMPDGSSIYSVNPSSGNYNIQSSGRYLNVYGYFNVEATVSGSLAGSYTAAGWSVSAGIGSNIIVRKSVSLSYRFDGNYGSSILQ